MTDASDKEAAKRIRDSLWRQGSLIDTSSLSKESRLLQAIIDGVRLPWSDGLLCIVVTHDCDLVNADFTKEPWAEFLLARKAATSKVDSTLRAGRNPRRIQFEARLDGVPVVLDASVHERCWVPRRVLAELAPDPRWRLEPGNLRLLVQWIAKRYVRSGFPDAFNERLRKVDKPFRAFLAKHDPHLRAIFLAVDPVGVKRVAARVIVNRSVATLLDLG